MTMMNADDLDDNVIGLASLFYLIADAEESLPKIWWVYENEIRLLNIHLYELI